MLMWMSSVRERLEELAELSEGWDGYGGMPLSPLAVDAIMPLMAQQGRFIQRGPAVSLTGDGGLIFRWDAADQLLELEATSRGELTVYFVDSIGGEHEEYGWLLPELSKWLWQASARP